MKKKIILFLMFMLVPFSVKADTIYKVDMNININEDGSADVQEIWDVKASSGSEWYKSMLNMDGIELTDFKVSKHGEKCDFPIIFLDIRMCFFETQHRITYLFEYAIDISQC